MTVQPIWIEIQIHFSVECTRQVTLDNDTAETFPSSGPGIQVENHGLTERSPAMIPTSNAARPSRFGKLQGPVPSSSPAGPVKNR